jgi:hypothetical protein
MHGWIGVDATAMSSWTDWPRGFTLPAAPDFSRVFPQLHPAHCVGGFSNISRQYNCFAWAASESSRRWEPDQWFLYYWPDGVPREYTTDAFIAAFQTVGYQVCNSGDLEDNTEKIAIYTNQFGRPTHAARQLENGNWTTKFGHLEDVEHINLVCLCGPAYGNVQVFMKRARNQA